MNVQVGRMVFKATSSRLARCPGLSQADKRKLERIAQDMPLVADISRSDLLLYAYRHEQEAVLIAQAGPHSTVPTYATDICGRQVTPQDEAILFKALRLRREAKGNRRMIDDGAPVIQEVFAVRGEEGKAIGALSVEATLIAYVRQKARSPVFQRAVRILQAMLLLNELQDIDRLSPFTANDGILVADRQHIIRYASGIATEHYRKLGYLDNLVGRDLASLDTGDEEMCQRALQGLRCDEKEFQERQRMWVRKAIPLIALPWGKPWYQPWKWFHRQPVGVLFAIHDATEERKKERELKVKSAMIQEVHHRVKNNLQTVAAVLRMQSRRSDNDQVKRILKDSISRILSMAVVHEYLSREEGQAINIREVTERIIQQTKQGVLSPEKQILIELEKGNNLYLPARQATACALIINELLQNSVEHGYEERSIGTVSVTLEDEGDYVRIVIADDGEGLPSSFQIDRTNSMGLHIVQTLVQDDLGGTLEIKSNGGVQATVRFSKKILEGEEHWNGKG